MNKNDIMKLYELGETIKKQLKIYPKGCCLYTSINVEKFFGFKRVYGYFIDDESLGNEHHWNYNPETDEYIDLTARQFDDKLPDVFVCKRGTPEAEKRYVELFIL